jgi:hypothetical protein
LRPRPLLSALAVLTLSACHPVVEPGPGGDEHLSTLQLACDAPALEALQGEGIVAVWADRELGPAERMEWLDPDGTWHTLGRSGWLWIHDPGVGAYRWRCADQQALVRPARGELTITGPSVPLLYQPGDDVERSVRWRGPSLEGLDVAIALQRERDESWLVVDGDHTLWSPEPALFARFEGGRRLTRAPVGWVADGDGPTADHITARLVLMDGERSWFLARAESTVLDMGRHWVWGDFHNHTNLSFDGCEDSGAECQPRGETPGSDVFLQAEASGLDFVALTDHAEFALWKDLEQELELSTWEHTLALVAEAEGGPVLPLVGYEWTGAYPNAEGEASGGHRTMIFAEPDPCEDFWVSAGERLTDKSYWGHEDYVHRENIEGTIEGFLDAQHAAEAECGPTRRLSWFHHPAISPPRPVSWTDHGNTDAGDRVVEIHSEHGSSECWDLSLEGCGWGVNEDRYVPTGSVQSALQAGIKLGFVGGTDNHEARPGSVGDGPGAIAAINDEDDDGVPAAYRLLWGPGAVSGVLVANGELSRAALFDGIEARNTMAATWIVRQLRVAALGANGHLYLPGANVPPGANPLQLIVEVADERVDSWLLEVVDPWGEIRASSDQPSLEAELDPTPGEALYVRVRAWSGGEEHRLWLSPFFGLGTLEPREDTGLDDTGDPGEPSDTGDTGCDG